LVEVQSVSGATILIFHSVLIWYIILGIVDIQYDNLSAPSAVLRSILHCNSGSAFHLLSCILITLCRLMTMCTSNVSLNQRQV